MSRALQHPTPGPDREYFFPFGHFGCEVGFVLARVHVASMTSLRAIMLATSDSRRYLMCEILLAQVPIDYLHVQW